jgi:hypothetical protein
MKSGATTKPLRCHLSLAQYADPDAKGEARLHGEIATSQITLDHMNRRIAKSKTISVSQISVCYEACGCGMWIAWMFMTKKFNPPSSPFSHGIC